MKVAIALLALLCVGTTNAASNSSSLRRRELGFETCFLTCIQGAFQNKDACKNCIRNTEAFLGDAQLPAGAIADLLQAKLGVGYTEMWCGNDDLPSGWRSDGKGGFTGCETTVNFPGDGTTSYQSHKFVKEEMKKYPAQQYNGEMWRGNELGFIVSNELYWPEELKPRSVGLGASVKQHMVLRPVLDMLFGTCNKKCQALIRSKVDDLFRRDQIKVQSDLKVLVHEVIMEIIFPGVAIPWDVDEFLAAQSSFTTLSTLTQMVSDDVANAIELVTKTREKLQKYYETLKTMVDGETRFGIDFDTADCGETLNNGSTDRNCVSQLAAGFLDVLLAAGGLSVPGALSTGLFVLYGDLKSANENPKFSGWFPEAAKTLPKGREAEFFYETMRFFAPVVGFPKWTTPPARATDDKASQYDGGVRFVLNLALANKDPNAWGSDAHVFRVRTMREYHDYFVGFADYAYDNSVAGGKMNRHCPGKALALQFGKIFFERFNQGAWHTKDTPQFAEATPFTDEFVIYKRSKEPCPYTCGTFDVGCKASRTKCEVCHDCASMASCSSQCPDKCKGGCKWWDAGCHWRFSTCKAGLAFCHSKCNLSKAKCVIC